jgi:hypothetical protein
MAVTTTGLAIAASIASAAATLKSGADAKQRGKDQAELFRRQGVRDLELAELEANRIEKKGEALAGRQRALLAAQGRDITSGSALLIQTDLAETAEFEKRLAKAGGDTQAAAAEQRAALAKLEGKQAFTSSLFRAGTSLLSSGSKIEGFG